MSNQVWNIPFELLLERQEGAPEHAGNKVEGQVASFCTMDNVQYYTLSSARGKEPVYAIVIISNVSKHDGTLMYMIDKVAKVEDAGAISGVINHLKKLSRLWKMRKIVIISARPKREPFQHHRCARLIR